MRKLRLVKVVAPIVEQYISGKRESQAVYLCPECNTIIGFGDKYCSQCGSEIDWKKYLKPSRKFQKLLDSL